MRSNNGATPPAAAWSTETAAATSWLSCSLLIWPCAARLGWCCSGCTSGSSLKDESGEPRFCLIGPFKRWSAKRPRRLTSRLCFATELPRLVPLRTAFFHGPHAAVVKGTARNESSLSAQRAQVFAPEGGIHELLRVSRERLPAHGHAVGTKNL